MNEFFSTWTISLFNFFERYYWSSVDLQPCVKFRVYSTVNRLSIYKCAKSFQSCLTLCGPVDCSPPASSVPGILQARILGWIAISSSRGSSQPRDPACISSVQFSRSVLSDSLRPPGVQHARPSCPSPTPGVYSNSCPSRR